MWGISWLSAELLAFLEGLCSMELVVILQFCTSEWRGVCANNWGSIISRVVRLRLCVSCMYGVSLACIAGPANFIDLEPSGIAASSLSQASCWIYVVMLSVRLNILYAVLSVSWSSLIHSLCIPSINCHPGVTWAQTGLKNQTQCSKYKK
jgi:hypothetical protein